MKKISIYQIIKNNKALVFLSVGGVQALILAVIMFGSIISVPQGVRYQVSAILLALAVVAFAVVVIQVLRIRYLLQFGQAVPGIIKEVYSPRTGLMVTQFAVCTYTYQGREYQTDHAVKGKWEPGAQITLLVDPKNPGRTLMKEAIEV